tara:strand:+ start:57 stop:602 length:546 start_codon:yes stop_codon:yes gene_type:complete
MKIVKIYNLLVLIMLFTTLVSCGVGEKVKKIRKPVDLRSEPLDPDERARRNIEEGRGVSLGGLANRKTTYEFSTSNPMWRASLETLDFIPLSTVDYSGGMIITDWYSDNNSQKQSLKITVRFLSNEIRADSLKIIVHKKNCRTNNNCETNVLPENSKIQTELRSVILKKAALLKQQGTKKK